MPRRARLILPVIPLPTIQRGNGRENIRGQTRNNSNRGQTTIVLCQQWSCQFKESSKVDFM